jgi:energy-coupling factor transporter ATP-binding protein EcfA2
MSIWKTYPTNYRENEVHRVLEAVQAGECASIIGLSGAGKSNLLGFIANRPDVFTHPNALVDCNRLRENTADELFRLIRRTLGDTVTTGDEFDALDLLIENLLAQNGGTLTLLLDRFEILVEDTGVASNLRALRDAHKYQLTFITATRRPLDPASELAELFFGHTFWLGPLSKCDTQWNISRYAQRVGQDWDNEIVTKMQELTWGYPSLLRAVSEAYANGTKLELAELRDHPAIQRRVKEFWDDEPSDSDLRNSGLEGLALLELLPGPQELDTSQLTEKEFLLLEYLQAHPLEVCSKDDLVQAVWPEDLIYERGIRDDSLAQLVRRLRVKIEPDPSAPRYIQTVPGRGYLFSPQ